MLVDIVNNKSNLFGHRNFACELANQLRNSFLEIFMTEKGEFVIRIEDLAAVLDRIPESIGYSYLLPCIPLYEIGNVFCKIAMNK